MGRVAKKWINLRWRTWQVFWFHSSQQSPSGPLTPPTNILFPERALCCLYICVLCLVNGENWRKVKERFFNWSLAGSFSRILVANWLLLLTNASISFWGWNWFHVMAYLQVQSTLQNFFLNTKEELYLLQIDAKKVCIWISVYKARNVLLERLWDLYRLCYWCYWMTNNKKCIEPVFFFFFFFNFILSISSLCIVFNLLNISVCFSFSLCICCTRPFKTG